MESAPREPQPTSAAVKTIEPVQFKLVIYGPTATGKTGFAEAFTDVGYKGNHQATIGSAHWRWEPNDECHFDVWEPNGHERSFQQWPKYLLNTTHIIIGTSADSNDVFDLEYMQRWINDIGIEGNHKSNAKKFCVLFRCDIELEDHTSKNTWLFELAQKYGFPYFECSGKTGNGIKAIQEAIIASTKGDSGIYDDHQDVDFEDKSNTNNNKDKNGCTIQ